MCGRGRSVGDWSGVVLSVDFVACLRSGVFCGCFRPGRNKECLGGVEYLGGVVACIQVYW